MRRVAAEKGRRGDIWRIEGKDHEMVVERLTKYTIALNSISEPQPSGWGYDLNDWDNIIYRIREQVDELNVGDTVHLHVPTTDIYLLKISIDSNWPSQSAWFGYQKGRSPEPDIEDSGIYFHPSADENLMAELVFRPYDMIADGMSISDADGRRWAYKAPFTFINEYGEEAVPPWPLTVADDPERTARLNATSHDEQLTKWMHHSGVAPSALDTDGEGRAH